VPPERNPIDLAAGALQHRDRSRRDMDDRLARAGIGDLERADALDMLERVGYVDDARFATARAESLAGRGYGDEAIRHDLIEGHRVDAAVAADAVDALEPELERARALVDRLGRSPKTARHLARKGFGDDALAVCLGADVAESAG
jgi:regulatory protein